MKTETYELDENMKLVKVANDTGPLVNPPVIAAYNKAPAEVRRSTFGCINCLYAGIECKHGSNYKPAPVFVDHKRTAHATCSGYTYYD